VDKVHKTTGEGLVGLVVMRPVAENEALSKPTRKDISREVKRETDWNDAEKDEPDDIDPVVADRHKIS
jgi:hypothetical protein